MEQAQKLKKALADYSQRGALLGSTDQDGRPLIARDNPKEVQLAYLRTLGKSAKPNNSMPQTR